MRKLVVAIDGPAGAGKSTVAQLVAKKLNYIYIDTGAMYRAVAWKVLKENVPVDEAAIIAVAQKMDVRLICGEDNIEVFSDGENVTKEIRTPEVTAIVSAVAKLAPVREKMVILQRKMAANGGVVMDGRDIASHVLPNADIKLFLTASIHERAKRRWLEMKAKGYKETLAEVEEDVEARDKADMEREVSPLVKTEDAVLLDSTGMGIDEVVDKILSMCR